MIQGDTVKTNPPGKKGEIVIFENGTVRGNDDLEDSKKLCYIIENDIMQLKYELKR